MVQHVIVAIVFAVCLYLVIRRVLRMVANAKKGTPKCDTCTEINCPLRKAGEEAQCGCDGGCGCHPTSKTRRTPQR